MAWATWTLGAACIAAGGAAVFMEIDSGSLLPTGAALVGSIVTVMVAGKVVHDYGNGKGQTDE